MKNDVAGGEIDSLGTFVFDFAFHFWNALQTFNEFEDLGVTGITF